MTILQSSPGAIRKVIAGEIEEFFMNYPCHCPGQEQRFVLRIVRFRAPGTDFHHQHLHPLQGTETNARCA